MSPRMGGSRFIHCPGKQIAVLTTRPAEAGGIAYKTDALSPSEVVSELNALLQAAPRGLTRALTDRGPDLTPDVLTGWGQRARSVSFPFDVRQANRTPREIHAPPPAVGEALSVSDSLPGCGRDEIRRLAQPLRVRGLTPAPIKVRMSMAVPWRRGHG